MDVCGIGVSCYASRAREAVCREQLTNKDACVGPNTIIYQKIAVLEVREGLVWGGLLSFVLFASSVRHVESRRLMMGIQFSSFIGSFAD